MAKINIGWIMAELSIPAEEEPVLVTVRDDSGDGRPNYYVDVGLYLKDAKCWIVNNERVDVVAWMLFPDPFDPEEYCLEQKRYLDEQSDIMTQNYNELINKGNTHIYLKDVVKGTFFDKLYSKEEKSMYRWCFKEVNE